MGAGATVDLTEITSVEKAITGGYSQKDIDLYLDSNVVFSLLPPTIGFGTFQIDPEKTEEVVTLALEAGYKHVDTAALYGNEEGVGRAIAKYLEKYSKSRDEIYITTKLWPLTGGGMESPPKSYDQVITAFEQSINNLGVDYIDLYLTHAPFAGEKGRIEQWRAMIECQERGFCKSIGVSNYSMQHLKELESEGLPLPLVNQLELHPHHQMKELLCFMAKKNITPIAYSSLAPLSTWREGYTSFGGSKMDILSATPPRVAQIAKKLGVTGAQVLLRYGIQKGWRILPKSTNEARMKENLALDSFKLKKRDMEMLDFLENGHAYAFGSKGLPFDPTQIL